MTTRPWLAHAFPGAEDKIQRLRCVDARFAEACDDFNELSDIHARLLSDAVSDERDIDIVRVSLAELELELKDKLAAGSADQLKGAGRTK